MKTIKTLFIIVLVIIVLPLIGYLGWLLKKGVPLEIVTVNKSYIKYQGSENEALNYILDEHKILTSGNRTYDLSLDHIGTHWLNGEHMIKYPRLRDIDKVVSQADLVYYADAAGIWSSDVKKLEKGEEDQLIYGGVNNTDYLLIKKLLEQKKLLLVECSFLGPPTESLIRYNIEKLSDVYYIGWKGRYVSNLANEPEDAKRCNWKKMYKESSGNNWNYSGPGIVLINVENKQVVVLKEGADIVTTEGLIVSSELGMEAYNLPESVNFHGWFSLLHPGKNETISQFKLNPTEQGTIKLNAAGLPPQFPALIKADENFYFMAGNFGENNINSMLTKVLLFNKVKDAVLKRGKSPSVFYFSYFHPFMDTMVEQAIAQKEEE